MNIKWQEPPAPKTGRGDFDYDAVGQKLMDRPGAWALVHEGMKSRTRMTTWKKRGFDSTTRPNPRDPKIYDVYVRYVEVTKVGTCDRCGKRGKVNADGLCKVHAPLGRVA